MEDVEKLEKRVVGRVYIHFSFPNGSLQYWRGEKRKRKEVSKNPVLKRLQFRFLTGLNRKRGVET